MKKILFSLIALVCSMSMNAQVMKVLKNGEEVATYKGSSYTVVYEEEPPLGKTGTTTRTGDIEVAWVQLWENGPRFAEYNVGAANNKAEDCGGYYTWGGSIDKDPDGAYKKGTDALTGTDDTATNLWGENWRMPTKEELQALLQNCDAEWTTVNGMNGRKFTGKGDYKDNSVFLPATGFYYGSVKSQDIRGDYWASTPGSLSDGGSVLMFYDDYQTVDGYFCANGSSVRAVLAE